MSANALLLALAAVFDPDAAADGHFALSIDGDWFCVTVASGSIDIAHGRAGRPSVAFEADAATLRSIAFGREPRSPCWEGHSRSRAPPAPRHKT